MDNNNNPGQPFQQSAANQPFQQPMMNQPSQQPAMGQPYQQQPMNGQYPQQPMNGQYPQQPMARPPKQPMDPAKKKKLILGFVIGGVVLALGITAAIAVPIVLKIDYGPAYSTVKEMESGIYSIYSNYDCKNALDKVNSTYISTETYADYVKGCKEIYRPEVNELVTKLGDMGAVKRDDKINAQFTRFKAAYDDVMSGDAEALASKLELWKTWHDYVFAEDDLSSFYDSSDAEYTTVANILIESGNETFRTYGENWLQKIIEVSAAKRARGAAVYGSTSDYKSASDNFHNKEKELNDWIAANKPDVKSMAPIGIADTSRMYSEFQELYKLIAKAYEENYNDGSGDCEEFFGEVYCE